MDVYSEVTGKIISALESGVVPWRQPWRTTSPDGLPLSLSTRKPYRGINVWLLALSSYSSGYSSPWWGTYRKINETGGQVRKGETSTLVTFWKRYPATETDESGAQVRRDRFVLRYYRVFNAEQAEWQPGKSPAVETIERREVDAVDAADKIIANYPNGPETRHVAGSGAAYSGERDVITLPPRDTFNDAPGYYSTHFHEMTHSTGHARRCNRPGIVEFDHFGSEQYAKEELVAELGASFLCAVAGISTTIESSAAYVSSWLGALRADPKLIINAAAQAQRATDHILGVHFGTDDTESE